MGNLDLEGEGMENSENVINKIPITGFASSHVTTTEGKLIRNPLQPEDTPMDGDRPSSPVTFGQAIRLPNMATLQTEDANSMQIEDSGMASPTSILRGNTTSVALDNLRSKKSDEFKQIEGEMFRKAPEGKLKRYWFCLLGKELYCYRKQQEEKHKGMHSLVGVYVLEEEQEKLENGVALFPFKLIFPNNKARTYYLLNEAERNEWIKVIKQAIGYTEVSDFYDIGHDVGKGKFGQVKVALHKKSGLQVAVKVIKKKDMK